MNQKGFGLIEILLVVAIVALLAYGGYTFWEKNKKVDINNVQQVEDNIKDIRQNPVELHDIKMKAAEDINKINQKTRQMASSAEDLIK
jgi:prepilin-type N-terminal cleavage/methylation domain-containing protein